MTFGALRAIAYEATENSVVRLVFPKCYKRPAKFPRGELLCVNCDDDRVWLFDAWRILKWLDWAEKQP